MTDVWILRTKDEVGLVNRVFAAAIGEHGRERCVEEMANYAPSAQEKMTITGLVALD